MGLTVLNLAVPQLSRELAPSSAQLLWIVDIYGSWSRDLLVSMGSHSDRIGRRERLLFGTAGFAVASVAAAFPASAGMLVAARSSGGLLCDL